MEGPREEERCTFQRKSQGRSQATQRRGGGSLQAPGGRGEGSRWQGAGRGCEMARLPVAGRVFGLHHAGLVGLLGSGLLIRVKWETQESCGERGEGIGQM